MRNSAHASREFGYVAKSDANTGYKPNKFDKFTSVEHENTGLFGVLTMFESSVSHVSHDDFALQIESKESMLRETDCRTTIIGRQ